MEKFQSQPEEYGNRRIQYQLTQALFPVGEARPQIETYVA